MSRVSVIVLSRISLSLYLLRLAQSEPLSTPVCMGDITPPHVLSAGGPVCIENVLTNLTCNNVPEFGHYGTFEN